MARALLCLLLLGSLSLRADTLLERIKKKVAVLRANGPAYAVDCFVPPERKLAGSPPQIVQKANYPLDLTRPTRNLPNILGLLKLTPSGKADAEAFAQKHARGEILIGDRDHNGQSRCPDKAVACYYGATKTIYIDHESELGALAPVLYHEIRHALHPPLARAHEVMAKLKQRMQTLSDEDEMARLFWQIDDAATVASFTSERDAYQHAYLVEAELLAYFPTYYFDMKRRAQIMYPRTLSDDEIVRRYGLDAQTIAKLKAGNCKEIPSP